MWSAGINTICTLVPLGPTDAAHTAPGDIGAAAGAAAATVSLIARNGVATLVTACGPNKGGDAGWLINQLREQQERGASVVSSRYPAEGQNDERPA